MNRLFFALLLVLRCTPMLSMLAELENDITAAIALGKHSGLIQALEAHETAVCSAAGQALKDYAPNANIALGEINTAAEMAAAIASVIPGGATIATIATDIESVAGTVQQGMGSSVSTAGGSASTAAKNSLLVQAALDAQKAAQAGTGIGSRTLAGLVSVFSLSAVGIKLYVDWFSTDTSSSANQTQQRVAAYVADAPALATLLATCAVSGYYSITNKWYNDTVANAKATTAAVTNHVNTTTAVSDALAQVKQKQVV